MLRGGRVLHIGLGRGEGPAGKADLNEFLSFGSTAAVLETGHFK